MRAGLITAALYGCTYQPPTSITGDGASPDMQSDTPSDVAPPIDVKPDFWTAVTGAVATDNNLQKTTAASTWGDSGASSLASVASGDCYVEFTTAEFNKGKALGLSHGDTSRSFDDIDFDLQLAANGRVFIYEGATQVAQPTSYVEGDLFRIEVLGSAINYYKNGVLLLTRVKTPTYPVVVDAALFSPGATLQNVTFVDL
jgi:hypothetical protein